MGSGGDATSDSGIGVLGAATANTGSPRDSSINWTGSGQVEANGTLVKLDGSRQMKVFVGGAPDAKTDFITDITGYLT